MSLSHRAVSPAIRRAMVLAVMAGIVGISVADSVTVKQEVEVHSKTSALAPATETVPADTKLEILGVEHGWYHVKTPNGNVGYIRKDDLPANIDVASLQGNAATNGLSTNAAGKGALEKDALAYARNNNLDPVPLDNLMNSEKLITDQALRDFDGEGHVGPKAYRN